MFKKGHVTWNKGKKTGNYGNGFVKGFKHSDKTKLKMSKSRKGKKRNRPQDLIWRKKISEERKGKIPKGWNPYYWLGKKQPKEMVDNRMAALRKTPKYLNPKASESRRARGTIEWRLWREAVFARDNWTCQDCGARGVIIHPHHIKMSAYFPELRFAIDNGITLCVQCHLSTGKHTRVAKK